ncbi:hypothetical protein P8V03_13225 [Clostridium sp. A1-XYC3]|uniref:Uncharacterized protein n=1 Tax=Clostridium tanneri TaxID=3037988 RepID=A0ABU4JVF2_9CLOT|nr:CBO0543 family protein [Clostridium sp. A1-XYC3]MDW8802113.1 hypothetical protein [Clostridium sp. A1-XYC3]
MRYTLIRITMASLWITSACKWGDLKNWRRYYPTMLFFGMGNLVYHLVFCDKPLWKFQPDIIVPAINELFIIFTIFFATTLLFLSNLPKKLSHKVAYIALWVAIYISIELFTTSIGMQKNYNGWNIWWSVLHNVVVFPSLIIHHKNPILAWIIAFILLGFIMKIFNIPFLQK